MPTLGVEFFPIRIGATDREVPILKYMYQDVMATFNTTFYAYSNGDLLFTDTLIETLVSLKTSRLINLRTKLVMVVGCRTNIQHLFESEGLSWPLLTSWAVDYLSPCEYIHGMT